MSRITPIFSGSVSNGTLKLISPQRFNTYLQTLNGKSVDVTVATKGRKRSNQQNRYYWSVPVQLISEHVGYTPDEVHEILKEMFAPKKELVIKNNKGEGIHKIVPFSTTELLTVQFKDYIEQIQRWAAIELDLYIPDPEKVQL